MHTHPVNPANSRMRIKGKASKEEATNNIKGIKIATIQGYKCVTATHLAWHDRTSTGDCS